MSKVYILGNSGFLGGALMHSLKNTQIDICTAGRENCDVFVDLENDSNALVTVAEDGDYLVFFAAVSAPDICVKHKEFAEKINVTSTIDLIKSLTDKGVKVIFSSTDTVFGSLNFKAEDSTPTAPFGEYGCMKARVEQSFKDNPLVKIIRFSYVMGPGDKYTNMLLSANEENRTVEVFEGFERNVVALSDVTEGIYRLINSWNHFEQNVINFSGPDLISRWELTMAFANRFCPNLKCNLVSAPENFWVSRPQRIEMTSIIFSELLGREAKTIAENVKTWCN